MSLSKDSTRNSPWEFPDCPDCQRHIYVDKHGHNQEWDFICHKCGLFTLSDLPATERRQYE